MAAHLTDNCALLNNGIKMPLLGLGCWQAQGKELEAAVEVALEYGYRHIDTAYSYLNEEEIGRGLHKWLKKSDAKREDVFIVSKLPMIGMYEGGAEKFLRISLMKLNLAYVDLYLVHCPAGLKGKNDEDVFPFDDDGNVITDEATDLIVVWKDMEKMVELGLTKAIGVSNYSIKQLRKMNAIAEISPTVNQVELHVAFQQPDMVAFCQKNSIVVTGYAPLASPGRKLPEATGKIDKIRSIDLLSNPVVRLVADKHGVTPAQVLIRYLIQKGIVAIPKSVTPQRIKINADVFSFTLDEVDNAALMLLDRGKEGRVFRFLEYPGLEDHPET